MRTHIVKHHRFVCCCIFSLTLPWGCLFGAGEDAAAQMVPLEVLIKRFNQTEEKGVTYDKANPPSDNWGGECAYACQLVNAMGKRGDRTALPFLAEKSISTNIPVSVRARAATAYVKIAGLDESVGFMRKLYEDHSLQGWFDLINKAFREKVQSEEKSLTEGTRKEISLFFLEIVQTAKSPRDARDADLFLFDRIPEYADSRQRATLSRYANTGTEYTTNTFNPIKAHFDKIPPSKRVDLRDRFPDLPPLPEDKADRSFSAITLAVGATFAAACAAILIALKRRRTRNHADGHPNNLR